jgi:hypothetical protein
MNKYIEQLAVAAGSTHKQSLGVYQFYGDELETFVALIVAEAIEVMYNTEQIEAAQLVDRTLREHFGINK